LKEGRAEQFGHFQIDLSTGNYMIRQRLRNTIDHVADRFEHNEDHGGHIQQAIS